MNFLPVRWRKSLAATVAFHIAAAAALGLFVYLHPISEIEPEILDVSLADEAGPAAPATVSRVVVPVVEKDAIAEKPQEQVQSQAPEQTEPVRPAAGGSTTTASQRTGNSSSADGSASGSGQGAAAPAKPAGPPPGTNVPVTRPYKVSGGNPAYPGSARAQGIQGTVYVRALVNAGGGVDSASVTGSSGNAALDNAAVQAVYGWGFSPARDRYGARCRCYISVPVSFRLR